MKRGFEFGGRYANDPIGSDKPRGKSNYRRKSGRDPGLTPTEQHQKNELMRQFMKNPEGGGIGNTDAYRSAECWCECGRLKLSELGKCAQCAKAAA